MWQACGTRAHGQGETEGEESREGRRERERLPMLISAAGPLVLSSMQLGWMRDTGFQHNPISINLAMLEATHTTTMPLGQSMPSRVALRIHTYMLTNKLLLCGVVCNSQGTFFYSVAYIHHFPSLYTNPDYANYFFQSHCHCLYRTRPDKIILYAIVKIKFYDENVNYFSWNFTVVKNVGLFKENFCSITCRCETVTIRQCPRLILMHCALIKTTQGKTKQKTDTVTNLSPKHLCRAFSLSLITQ